MSALITPFGTPLAWPHIVRLSHGARQLLRDPFILALVPTIDKHREQPIEQAENRYISPGENGQERSFRRLKSTRRYAAHCR